MKKLTDAYTDENGVSHTGHCWMNQNLALKGQTEINSTYSNVSEEYSWVLPVSQRNSGGTGVGRWTNEAQVSTGNVYNGTHVDGTADNTSNNTGAWYNFISSSAGTATRYSNDGDNVMDDICPNGWKLPTAYNDSNKNSGDMYYIFNNESIFTAPWNIALNGHFDGDGNPPDAAGLTVFYVTSTIYSDYNAYVLNVNTSGFNGITTGGGGGNFRYGNKIRCIARY